MAGKAHNVVALGATLAATAVAKKLADSVWKMGSGGKTPPTDPSDPDIDIREAILFAVISGAAVSVVRTFLARRLAQNERRQQQRAEKSVLPSR